MAASKNVFSELIKDYGKKNVEKFKIRIGETEIGDLVELGPREMGHTLISGMSRSGKSTLAMGILREITQFSDVAIFSPKSQDYVEFDDVALVTSDLDKFGTIIRRTVGILENRNKASLKKSKKAKVLVEDDNPPLYIVIDEFRTFSENSGEAAMRALKRLIAEGAGLNIFLILIAQTAHKKIFPDGLKDNMMTLIAFKARDAYASRVAIGSRKAEFLELRQAICRNVDKEWLITKY